MCPCQSNKEFPNTACNAREANNARGMPTCGALRAFDRSRLPFQWLPGLPVAPAQPLSFYENAMRIEIMHTHDRMPGPLWLYGAAGSGTWWQPGRRLVVRNAIDAILRYNSLEKFVFKMEEKVNSKGFRTVREHALRWRSAFRNTSWETIITRAAAGEQCYSLFAMAIRLFSGHSAKSGWLAPMPGGWAAGSLETWRNYVQRNMSLDSIIFAEQVHLYPRPNDRNTKQFPNIEQIVDSCFKGEPLPQLHYIPEMVDFRWGGPSATNLMRSDAVSADAEGKRRCAIHNATIAASCTSCSAEAAVLCGCSFTWPAKQDNYVPPAVDTAIKLTRTTSMLLSAHHYTTKALQKCCVSGMNQLERKRAVVL